MLGHTSGRAKVSATDCCPCSVAQVQGSLENMSPDRKSDGVSYRVAGSLYFLPVCIKQLTRKGSGQKHCCVTDASAVLLPGRRCSAGQLLWEREASCVRALGPQAQALAPHFVQRRSPHPCSTYPPLPDGRWVTHPRWGVTAPLTVNQLTTSIEGTSGHAGSWLCTRRSCDVISSDS